MTDDNDFDQPVNLSTDEPNPLRPQYPLPTKSRNSKKVIIVLASLLVIIGLIFGAVQLFGKKSSSNVPVTPVQATTPKIPAKDIPDAGTTKPYDNGPMGLSLTYPTTWTATETTDSGVRIESPVFSYATLSKGSVSGNFRIYIRKGARPVDSKYIGRGVAIQPSEKLVYTKPAVGQRTDTLLSVFGLDTPDNFAYFFVAGNFNLKIGDTLGPNYGKEPETFIIAGGYSSKDLTDDLATNLVAPDMIKTSNAYKQAIDILKSIQLN